MYKIIGADQKEYGPASGDEIRQWVAEGRANGQTMLKVEGATEWKPLVSYAEFAGLTFLTPKSPTPPMLSAASSTPAKSFSASNEPLPIGRCLSGGWRLLKHNFSLLFFSAFLIAVIRLFFSMIPVVNLVSPFFKGVFYGGLYLVFLRRLRNEPASVGVAFQGFGVSFVQLLLTGVVGGVLIGLGLLFCFVPGIFLYVAWSFAVPLVADKQLRFWDAMELSRKTVSRQWIRIAVLMLIAFLPLVLFAVFANFLSMNFLYEMKNSGKIDTNLLSSNPAEFVTQMENAAKLFAEKYAYLGGIQLFLVFLVLPFGRAVMSQAYEILFGTRPTPPA